MSNPASATEIRQPSVAGTFYPSAPAPLRSLVRELLDAASGDGVPRVRLPAGILVPHAGLVYSGGVAAAAWRLLAPPADLPSAGLAGHLAPTVVILGTNHVAGWLDGIAVWDAGAWRTPLGDVAVDDDLAASIIALGGPFASDHEAHRGEHSIEVQLPFLARVEPAARIVPLAVALGTGDEALSAGAALGRLLADRAGAGVAIVLAISTDMAHYPPHVACERVTRELLPLILDLDAPGLAAAEREVRRSGGTEVACGMCGIEPAVVGLAALRAMGVMRGTALAAATSADAGASPDRTVGYLAVAFEH